MTRALGNALTWLQSQSPEKLESNLPKLAIRYAAEDPELSENQKAILQEMISIFARYHNQTDNLSALRFFLHRLSNPDSQMTVIQSKRGIDKSLFIFDEKMSLKSLVKYILNLVRNHSNSTNKTKLPRYKTIRAQENHSRMEEDSKFSVEQGWQQKLKFNLAIRRKNRRFDSIHSFQPETRNRVLRYKQWYTGRISPLPSLVNAAVNGNYDLSQRKFQVSKADLLRPIFAQKEIFNIMLVLDVSKSITWVIPHIEKLLGCLSENVSRVHDNLGLITFKDDLAQIYHYPTPNTIQVIGTVNHLNVKGSSPLEKGLQLANQVLSRSRYRLAGMKNLVLLISDCYPEPLEGGHKNLLEEPSYKKVIKAAKDLAHNQIRLLIIDPASDTGKKRWSKKLVEVILKNWGTRYLELKPVFRQTLLSKNNAVIEKDTMQQLMELMGELKVE